jgi:hypothetical protein
MDDDGNERVRLPSPQLFLQTRINLACQGLTRGEQKYDREDRQVTSYIEELKDWHYRTLLRNEILGHEIADEHGDLVPLFHVPSGIFASRFSAGLLL